MPTRERRTSVRSALPRTIAHRSVLISSASSTIFVRSAYASPLWDDVSGVTVVENPASQLNEIVVTSQRRSENLQTIPLSVTAATASDFLNEGITDNDHTDVRQSGLSLKVEQSLAAARLVNITSWRNVNGFVLLDQDATRAVCTTC